MITLPINPSLFDVLLIHYFKFEFPAACWSETDLSSYVVWRKSRLRGCGIEILANQTDGG